MAPKYKKFIDNGNGDCMYCRERSHDCRCAEKTAKSLGFHWDSISVTKPVERPPMPEGLTPIKKLTFLVAYPTSIKTTINVWRKGNQWFKNGSDLVDHFNGLEPETS